MFENALEKLTLDTAEEYKKTVDGWAVTFARRHLPADFDYGDPPDLAKVFGELSKKRIFPSCVQSELIIGTPQEVTYSFTSGDMILAELKIKLNFEV